MQQVAFEGAKQNETLRATGGECKRQLRQLFNSTKIIGFIV